MSICKHCGANYTAWSDEEYPFHNDTTGDVPHCVGEKDATITRLTAENAALREDNKNLSDSIAVIEQQKEEETARLNAELAEWEKFRAWVVSGGCTNPRVREEMPVPDATIGAGKGD